MYLTILFAIVRHLVVILIKMDRTFVEEKTGLGTGRRDKHSGGNGK